MCKYEFKNSITLDASTRTAEDAAKTIGCNINQIVKSLVFKTVKSNQPVLILASGSNKVIEKNIENIIGEKIEKADAKFTKEITGFSIGGIPPYGHKNKITHIFIDSDFTSLNELWAAAGTPFSVFRITSKDLISKTQGKIIKIKS